MSNALRRMDRNRRRQGVSDRSGRGDRLWEAIMMNRRKALIGTGLIAVWAGAEFSGYGLGKGGAKSLGYISRWLSHQPIEHVAGVIEEMGYDLFMGPKNNGGNRNLVIMQEVHNTTDFEQYEFFKRLQEEYPMDSFFLDGVTSDPDDLLRSLGIIGRIHNSRAEISERTMLKMQRYGKMARLHGMESPGIYLDMEGLRRISQLMDEIHDNSGNSGNKQRRQEITEHLGDMRYFSTDIRPENVYERREAFSRDEVDFQNEYRNPSMVKNIEKRLRSYSTGGAIVGFLHIRPEDFELNPGYKSFLPYLDKTGISYLVMDAEAVAHTISSRR